MHMHNRIHVILVCCLLGILGNSPVFGFTKLAPEMHHFMWVSADFGYSSLINQTQAISNPHGFSPAVSGGYRLYYNDFVFQTGLSVRYGFYQHLIPNDHLRLPMIDTEGDAFVMNAMVSDCRDITHVIDLGVPLLFGYEYKKFYFLVGLTPSMIVLDRGQSESHLKTYGEYEQFMDDFMSMTNHAFVDDEIIESRWLSLPYDMKLTGHLEVGMRLDEFISTSGFQSQKKNTRIYISLFAEAGGMFSFASKDGDLGHLLHYEETEKEGLKFFVTPALMSIEMNHSTITPMVVGVKFTCTFGLPDEPRRKIYDSSNKKVERNNNQVIR